MAFIDQFLMQKKKKPANEQWAISLHKVEWKVSPLTYGECRKS